MTARKQKKKGAKSDERKGGSPVPVEKQNQKNQDGLLALEEVRKLLQRNQVGLQMGKRSGEHKNEKKKHSIRWNKVP